MVPLRQALIVKEHGVLPYPEGTACADILLAGEGHSSKAGKIFAGLGFAAVYKFIADGLKIFPSEVDWSLDKFKGAGIGCDVLPALLGVGYICGYRVSSLLLSGAVLSWFCLMPCIVMFGGDAVLFPGKAPISELGTWGIWSSYVRYIGAGALAAGGIIGLIKTMPMLVTTFRQSLATIGGSSGAAVRTNKDLPMTVIIGGVILMVLLIGLLPIIPLGVLGAFLVVIFGFFFATVSSRIVGVVGSSNNPVSGMTIAAMLFTTFAFILAGNTGQPGMVAAVTVGSLVAIIAAMAADTSQDLKTGYILGATPFKQQLGRRCRCRFVCGRHPVPAGCGLGLWLPGAGCPSGYADEDGSGRRYVGQSALGLDWHGGSSGYRYGNFANSCPGSGHRHVFAYSHEPANVDRRHYPQVF